LSLGVRSAVALLELFWRLLEPLPLAFLVLLQVALRVALLFALLALLALLPLLALLSLLAPLAVLPALLLPLPEGAVAQLLLLLDHVAELIKLRHHIVVVVAVLAWRRHLQVLHHLLELLQKLARGVLGPVAREILQPVEHA